MITGDNPLTAVHVAKDVEIVDREVMILDLKEGTTTDGEPTHAVESCVADDPQSWYGETSKRPKLSPSTRLNRSTQPCSATTTFASPVPP